MRAWIPLMVAGFTLLTACSDGTSSNPGSGGGGSAGGSTSTTSNGGGGSAGNGGSGGAATTTTTTTSTSSGTTTTAADLCATAGPDAVSFAADVQPIFSQSCGSNTTCHLKGNPSEGLSLKAGNAYAALVGVPAKQNCNGQSRIEPGSASGSYLVNKITDTDICGNNKKMPLQSNLSAAKKQTIIDWICQGAQDN